MMINVRLKTQTSFSKMISFIKSYEKGYLDQFNFYCVYKDAANTISRLIIVEASSIF